MSQSLVVIEACIIIALVVDRVKMWWYDHKKRAHGNGLSEKHFSD